MSKPEGARGSPSSDRPSGHRVAALASAVRRRRESLGLRQSDLAALAACSDRFVHTLESGKPTLRLDKVLDVLEVLGLGLAVVAGRGDVRSSEAGPGGNRAP